MITENSRIVFFLTKNIRHYKIIFLVFLFNPNYRLNLLRLQILRAAALLVVKATSLFNVRESISLNFFMLCKNLDNGSD